MTQRKTKLKGILKGYLEMKGKHHQTAEGLFAEVMTETRGQIIPELLKADIKEIRELKQFTLPAQMPKIKKELMR